MPAEERTQIDRNEHLRATPAWAVVLALLPWLILIGGGLAMCGLYEKGEPIGATGYAILTVMSAPLLVTMLAGGVCVVWRLWRPGLDVECTYCGRAFDSMDLTAIRRSGRCPGCGGPVPDDDFPET